MKEIVNNRIVYDNHLGRIVYLDKNVNQSVRNDASPTFGSMNLTGSLTVEQNLYVEGNTSILNTNIVEVKDNIILINDQEIGAGVTLNQSGFEVDRGILENFRIVYNENNKRVEVGPLSNLQPITIRESVPLENGIMIWDSSNLRVSSRNTIDIPIIFSNNVNSISSTTGSIVIAGGIGIKKDIFIDGSINFSNASIYTQNSVLNLTSTQKINLNANEIVIPSNVPIVFGINTQFISGNNLTNTLSVTSLGDINLTSSTKINIPNGIPITFSTQNEKIYTDNFNNMIIASSQNIYLNPNGKVVLNTNNTQSFVIINNGNALLNINNNTIIASIQTIISNTSNSSDTSTGSLIVNGGVAIKKNLNVGGTAGFLNGINMINTKISNLQDPTNLQDAATMNYVNLVKQGLFVKDSVKVATVLAQNLTTDFVVGSIIDNYTLILGDRILIKNQINQIQNGLYIITSGTPIKPLDFQNGTSAAGIFVFIEYGNINASLGFICNSASPNDIVGTSSLNFTQFTGLGQVQVGPGLLKTFNKIDINVDNSSIEIVSNALRIKNTAVSTGLTGGSGIALTTTPDQSHVNKLGTINTGVWNASTIQVLYGGTGKNTINNGNIIFGNGSNPVGTDQNLYYDTVNTRIGLGTNIPSKDIEIKSSNTITLLLNADSNLNNSNAKPEIQLSYSGTHNSYLAMTRNYNEYANNIYSDALVLSNQQTDTSSIIQFATNNYSRMTILSNGNIGINTSSPSSTLHVSGTFNASGIVRFNATNASINSTSGGVVMNGGLSISSSVNSQSVVNGGALTINGGASILQDVYIGGSITANSSSFNYITITSANNLSNRGILFQRYQTINDSALGNVVNDTSIFLDSIPNQSLISSLLQVKFSTSASAIDNYYNNWWIKITSGNCINQVRQILSYNGAQQIATLTSSFTTQNPSIGDTILFYNKSYVANYYDDINATFTLAYTSSNPALNIISNGDANLRLKSLYSTDTTISTNSSSGSVILLGGISINNTNNAASSTYGGTITTNGGVGIQKNLLVGGYIGLGGSGFAPQESFHIRKTVATSRFENDQSSYSYIDFNENGTNNRYGILLDSQINEFCLTNSSSGQNPYNSNRALTINNLGYIGINTTTNIISPLSLNANNFISTNSTTGYLGLVGAAYNTNDNSMASRILLYANNNSSGSMKLYAGNTSSGNVSIFTNNDIERFRVNYNGNINILVTTVSDSNTTGALIVNGGLAVSTTQNATSISSGGAITINGGASISKDTYIGGNLYVQGSFTVTGAITNPTIIFNTFTNCSLVEYFNNNLSVNGNMGVLTFGFTVIPNNASQNCQVIFTLPGRNNSFTKAFECISSCSGYTDETNIIPLMNVLSYAVVTQNQLSVKFQSISTNTHTFQLQCTYILA